MGVVPQRPAILACDTDARVIATAQRALVVDNGRPGTEAELVPIRTRGRVPFGVLGPDTGDANQNPAPCGDRRPARPSTPSKGDTPCGPGRICDTDMETAAGPRR